MKRIRVNASVDYDVIVGRNLLADCGALIKEVIPGCRVCIVTDDTVAEFYLDVVKKSVTDAGYKACEYVFEHGEKSKNAQTLVDLLEFLATEQLTRSDIIIALGGGVTGDMAGFAAATYLRGIRFIQIPTTFLADIDSSVGGKTAVNLASGKNLWGAFHQPSMVICDVDCLKTLPKEYFLDGVAEAVKYAVLEDEALVNMIDADIDSAICRCIEIKRDVVACDEFENGRRKFLNLGHTLGHSIEALSDFSITHGHAVAIGMVLASRGGERMGVTESGTTDKLIDILEKFGLPTSCKYTASQLASHALSDKKRDGDSITLVIPEKIGSCKLCKVPISELEAFAER